MSLITLSPKESREAIVSLMKANQVPMLHGSPGIGKSAIIRSIAEHFNLKLIDLRLSQADPTDLLGFPRVAGDKAGYVPMETFPVAGDALPIKVNENNKPIDKDGKTIDDFPNGVGFVAAHYKGWLLFLDELPLASPDVQKASYKLILDRMVGDHHLHPKVAVVAAGNKETDGSLVEPMSQALRSRMVHLFIQENFTEWEDWALNTGFDYRILAYLNFEKSAFYNFRGDADETTYACPRTWEMVNNIIKPKGEEKGIPLNGNNKLMKAMISGAVGEGVGPNFITFCALEGQIPTLEQIKADPLNTPIPERMDVTWMLAGMLGKELNKDTIDTLLKYANRLSVEFQIIVLRQAIKRDMSLLNNPLIVEWVNTTSSTKF